MADEGQTTIIAEIQVELQNADQAKAELDALLQQLQSLEAEGTKVSSALSGIASGGDMSAFVGQLQQADSALGSLAQNAQQTKSAIGDLGSAGGSGLTNLSEQAETTNSSLTTLASTAHETDTAVATLGSSGSDGLEQLGEGADKDATALAGVADAAKDAEAATADIGSSGASEELAKEADAADKAGESEKKHGEEASGAAGKIGDLGKQAGGAVGEVTGLGGAFAGGLETLTEFSGELGPLGAGLAAAGVAIGGVKASFEEFDEEVGNLVHLSAQLHMPTAEIEAFEQTMKQAGFSTKEGDTALQGFDRQYAQLKTQLDEGKEPTGKFVDGLEQIGVKATDSGGKLRPVGDILNDVMTRMATAGANGGKFANGMDVGTAAMDIFSRSGARLAFGLEQVNGKYDENVEHAKELGNASDENVQKWEQWTKTSADLDEEMGHLGIAIGSSVAPAITAIAGGAARFIEDAGKIKDVVGGWVGALEKIPGVAGAVEAAFKSMTAPLQALKGAGDFINTIADHLPGATKAAEDHAKATKDEAGALDDLSTKAKASKTDIEAQSTAITRAAEDNVTAFKAGIKQQEDAYREQAKVQEESIRKGAEAEKKAIDEGTKEQVDAVKKGADEEKKEVEAAAKAETKAVDSEAKTRNDVITKAEKDQLDAITKAEKDKTDEITKAEKNETDTITREAKDREDGVVKAANDEKDQVTQAAKDEAEGVKRAAEDQKDGITKTTDEQITAVKRKTEDQVQAIKDKATEQADAVKKAAQGQSKEAQAAADEQAKGIIKHADEQVKQVQRDAEDQEKGIKDKAEEQKREVTRSAEDQTKAVTEQADNQKKQITDDAEQQKKDIVQKADEQKTDVTAKATAQKDDVKAQADEQKNTVTDDAKGQHDNTTAWAKQQKDDISAAADEQKTNITNAANTTTTNIQSAATAQKGVVDQQATDNVQAWQAWEKGTIDDLQTWASAQETNIKRNASDQVKGLKGGQSGTDGVDAIPGEYDKAHQGADDSITKFGTDSHTNYQTIGTATKTDGGDIGKNFILGIKDALAAGLQDVVTTVEGWIGSIVSAAEAKLKSGLAGIKGAVGGALGGALGGGTASASSIAAINTPGAPVTGQLTISQIEQLAYEAGFRGNDVNTIAAIAMRENNGLSDTTGDWTGGGHTGLLQLSQQIMSLRGVTNPADARQQLAAAYAQWQARGGFNDWGGWNEQLPGGGSIALPVPTSPQNVINGNGQSLASLYPELLNPYVPATGPGGYNPFGGGGSPNLAPGINNFSPLSPNFALPVQITGFAPNMSPLPVNTGLTQGGLAAMSGNGMYASILQRPI